MLWHRSRGARARARIQTENFQFFLVCTPDSLFVLNKEREARREKSLVCRKVGLVAKAVLRSVAGNTGALVGVNTFGARAAVVAAVEGQAARCVPPGLSLRSVQLAESEGSFCDWGVGLLAPGAVALLEKSISSCSLLLFPAQGFLGALTFFVSGL
jgi:hypothetical protein